MELSRSYIVLALDRDKCLFSSDGDQEFYCQPSAGRKGCLAGMCLPKLTVPSKNHEILKINAKTYSYLQKFSDS